MGANAVYYATGRLEHGGTTFGSAFPHGGTALGQFSRLVVEPVTYSTQVMREEDNGTDEVLVFGSDLVVSFRLQEWHANSLTALIPGTRTDTGDVILKWPIAAQSAPSLTPLVFSATNVTEHPSLILLNAQVVWSREVRTPLSATRTLAWDFLVYGTPAASGTVGEMGILSKLATS